MAELRPPVLPVAKVVVCGGTGSGKSNFLLRYAHDSTGMGPSGMWAEFVMRDDHPPPAGQPQALGRIQLWEVSNTAARQGMVPPQFRGAAAVIVLFDVSDASSLHAATARSGWLASIRGILEQRPKGQPRPSIALVGNAGGRGGAGRAVSTADVEAWATKSGVGYCECSTDSRESTERVIDVALSASEAYSPCFRPGAVRLPRAPPLSSGSTTFASITNDIWSSVADQSRRWFTGASATA
jgi:Ras-related protein Rab-5C